jgi:hypothetical protein
VRRARAAGEVQRVFSALLPFCRPRRLRGCCSDGGAAVFGDFHCAEVGGQARQRAPTTTDAGVQGPPGPDGGCADWLAELVRVRMRGMPWVEKGPSATSSRPRVDAGYRLLRARGRSGTRGITPCLLG